MTTIGVRELRRDASRWLREVEAGGTVVVTNRGRPVAQLVPVPATGLLGLEATGRLSRPVRPLGDLLSGLATDGPPLSPRLRELRDDERY